MNKILVFAFALINIGFCEGGRIREISQDPPGQNNVYIPPGDVQDVDYRMATFQFLNQTSSIDTNEVVVTPLTSRSLARSGFFYTGRGRNVRCSGCTSCVNNLTEIHDPSDSRWHDDDCQFRQGNTVRQVVIEHRSLPNVRRVELRPTPSNDPITANVTSSCHKEFLITLYLNRELDRLASFSGWPGHNARNTTFTGDLARQGFFYLGNLNRTRCFFCHGTLQNWNIGDNVGSVHGGFFPDCPIVRGTEMSNVMAIDTPLSERILQYPCNFPRNPHMRSECARLRSFDNRWPGRRVAIPPAQIAQAGFFFGGQHDLVRCWYCNGRMLNFQPEDTDAWLEHAKAFPSCQFLLLTKGPCYVRKCLLQYSYIPRPIILRQRGGVLDNIFDEPRSLRPFAPWPQPQIIDPRVDLQRIRQRVESFMENSDIAQLILQMGFASMLVANVVKDRLIDLSSCGSIFSGDIYETAAELLDDVMKKEDAMRDGENVQNSSTLDSDSEDDLCS